MKKIILLCLLLLVGCGRRVVYIEGIPGVNGTNGVDGVNGTNGVDGSNGVSCYLDYRVDGDYVVCGDDETMVKSNVEVEPELELVTVCPNVAGSMPETFIKVDDQYLAFLSSNNYMSQRLIVLQENVTYITTDGRNVNFRIVNGDIVYLTAACN